MRKIIVANKSQLSHAAEKIIRLMNDRKIILFTGEMGAGKTTLIKAICHNLGVKDVVSSPTFSIVNEYSTVEGQTIYHFDFYRIKDIKEVFDIGYEDYFYSTAYCFVEWPEKATSIIPENAIQLQIAIQNSQRILNIAL